MVALGSYRVAVDIDGIQRVIAKNLARVPNLKVAVIEYDELPLVADLVPAMLATKDFRPLTQLSLTPLEFPTAGLGQKLETLWTAKQRGIGLGGGAVTGVIEGIPGVGALRLRARGWWQPAASPYQLSLTVEGTRFYGSWYTDLVGGATIEKPRMLASVWLSARMSATYGSTGAASASLQYFVTPAIAVEAAGGNYLRDPFQGLPRAGFIGGGVRLYAKRRVASTPAVSPQPLIAQHRGDSLVVRFRMSGAQSVAIAGSWNAWTPVDIHGLGGDFWEAALSLPPGTYYFNLIVDGKEWVVPGGVAVISDGMGGLVAVLMVP